MAVKRVVPMDVANSIARKLSKLGCVKPGINYLPTTFVHEILGIAFDEILSYLDETGSIRLNQCVTLQRAKFKDGKGYIYVREFVKTPSQSKSKPVSTHAVIDTGSNMAGFDFQFHGSLEECQKYIEEHKSNTNLGIIP